MDTGWMAQPAMPIHAPQVLAPTAKVAGLSLFVRMTTNAQHAMMGIGSMAQNAKPILAGLLPAPIAKLAGLRLLAQMTTNARHAMLGICSMALLAKPTIAPLALAGLRLLTLLPVRRGSYFRIRSAPSHIPTDFPMIGRQLMA
jgi:hypothetical protein